MSVELKGQANSLNIFIYQEEPVATKTNLINTDENITHVN